ncbi:serine/threonine protein phosphatase [Clostridium sp. C2-6-12]|uniref:PP2C family protein-serine/threonine phosphatase n=1 Tax=Clostridium sp. C2-6-12 TaxID=2698832 RepID=UPI00136B0FB5|nr:serine/threonine protein phosphatase [Clostridium sp. C2-6-12]
MRKLNSKFKTSFVSEEGTYLENKDYFAYVELDNYACYVVADGIDEDKELESAKIAVTAFIKDFTARPTMNRFILKKYIRNANNELITNSRNVRLKASITVVVTNYNKLVYSNIGNTRFYYFKDGYLREKSKDQSLAQQLADDEMISLDAMAKHTERNNLSSYLGQNKLNKIYISKKIKLSDGDVFALLTKGVWENCEEKEIEDSLEGAKEPKEVIDSVEDMVLSKQPKQMENYTLAMTFVEKAYLDPKRSKKIKIAIIAAILLLLIIAIGVGAFIIYKNKKQDDIATMAVDKKNAEEYIKFGNMEKADEEYKNALDIAKKYKLEDDIRILDDDYKYVGIIVDGDKALDSKKYEDALDKYVLALERAGDAEDIGRNYVLKKIDMVKNCIKVADLLTLADKQLDGGQTEDALTNYLAAKDLALDSYLKDEKKEAMDKIQKIYDQKAADAKQKKDDEDKAAKDKKQADDDAKKKEEDTAKKAEEEKKAADEKLNKAIDLRKNGDLSYTKGDYVSAKMYYALAKEGFEEINSHSLADELVEKIALMDKKINEVADKKGEADKYMQEADKRYSAGDSASAKVLYLLAKDVYNSLGDTDSVSKVTEKITAIDQASAKVQAPAK